MARSMLMEVPFFYGRFMSIATAAISSFLLIEGSVVALQELCRNGNSCNVLLIDFIFICFYHIPLTVVLLRHLFVCFLTWLALNAGHWMLFCWEWWCKLQVNCSLLHQCTCLSLRQAMFEWLPELQNVPVSLLLHRNMMQYDLLWHLLHHEATFYR